LIAGIYIWISSGIAAGESASIADLQRLETIKGLVFVAVSGLLFFVFAAFTLRHLGAAAVRLVESRRALMLAERQAVAGVFASSLAHDINNVLQIARGQLFELEGSESLGDDGRRAVTALEELHERLGQIAGHLVSASAERPQAARDMDLRRTVIDASDLLRRHEAVKERRLEIDLPPYPVVVRGEPVVVEQLLTNLVINAAEAVATGGTIAVRLAVDAGKAFLEVHDDGPGIPADKRESVFHPFHTTKERGTGLGLLSVKAGAESCGGTVEVDESPLGGALFRVVFPVSRTPARAAPHAEAS
jgi:two-component system sensor histidine kinase HydH